MPATREDPEEVFIPESNDMRQKSSLGRHCGLTQLFQVQLCFGGMLPGKATVFLGKLRGSEQSVC